MISSDSQAIPVLVPGKPRPAPLQRVLIVRRRAADAVARDTTPTLASAEWKLAPASPALLQTTGRPARLATHARALWDDRAFYLRVEGDDPHIWGTLTRHNSKIYNEEVMEVFLSPSGKTTQYFEFEISPRNVRWGGNISNKGGDPPKFRNYKFIDPATWFSSVAIEGNQGQVSTDPAVRAPARDPHKGWAVLFTIPYAVLGLSAPPAPGDSWRGNIYRIDIDGETQEFTCWSPTYTDPPAFHRPDYFGELRFAEADGTIPQTTPGGSGKAPRKTEGKKP